MHFKFTGTDKDAYRCKYLCHKIHVLSSYVSQMSSTLLFPLPFFVWLKQKNIQGAIPNFLPVQMQRSTLHLFIQNYKYNRKNWWSCKITPCRQGGFLWLHWQIYYPDVHKQGQSQWGVARHQSANLDVWELIRDYHPYGVSSLPEHLHTSALLSSPSASPMACFQFPALLLLSSPPPALRPPPPPPRDTAKGQGVNMVIGGGDW